MCAHAWVVALVANCQAGIVALVVIMLLPLMRRHLCHCQMVIVDLIMMALLPLSMRRHLCNCWTSIVALIARCWAGVVALVPMVLLPSMRKRLCHCCHCNCCPHDNGFVAVVYVQASLLLPSWHECPHNNGVVAPDLWRCCCPRHDGVIAVLKLLLLPLLQWRCCHHPCCCPWCSLSSWCPRCWCGGIFAAVPMAIVALVMMASSPLSVRRHVSAVVELVLLPLLLVVKLALLPLSRWRCCHWYAGFLPLLQGVD